MPNKEKSKKIWTDADYMYYVVNYLQKAINELDKHNWDKEKFLEDSSFQEICSFYSIQIGEYAKGLSQEFREKYPYKLWRGFAAVRDIYAHSYHSFEENIAWSTLTEDYPKDLQKCLEICKENGWEIPPVPKKINLNSGFDGRVLGALVSDAELEKARNEVRAEMNLQLMAIQQEREQERQEHERECQKSERIYNILIDEPENNCEKKFFDIVKHAIKVNKNYTEHNENLAIRDLLKAGFSHDEIADTLGKYSPLVRDKIEIEKNIQDVAEKNKMNSRSSAR